MMQFQPSRLQEACRDRRMRITDLADTTGLSRVTLSNLANGKIQNPQRETIIKLSWALKRPEKYFYSPIERNYVDTTVISYRSFSSRASLDNAVVEARLLIVKDVVQYLFSYINERNVDIPAELLKDHGTNLKDPDYIESMAMRLRNHWGLGRSIISNMTVLLENHGIICSRIDLPGKIESANSCSHFSNSDGDSAFVVTSSKATYFRQRFTLAHEVGHIVLQKEIEEQANSFASAFLMPHNAFCESVSKRTFSELESLKRYWGVSMAACARRLRDLYLISDNQYQSMNIELSRRGWRKEEPLDNRVDSEQPYYIREGYRFLFNNNVISPKDAIDEFNLYPSELVDYIGNEDLFMPEEPVITYTIRGKGKEKSDS